MFIPTYLIGIWHDTRSCRMENEWCFLNFICGVLFSSRTNLLMYSSSNFLTKSIYFLSVPYDLFGFSIWWWLWNYAEVFCLYFDWNMLVFFDLWYQLRFWLTQLGMQEQELASWVLDHNNDITDIILWLLDHSGLQPLHKSFLCFCRLSFMFNCIQRFENVWQLTVDHLFAF